MKEILNFDGELFAEVRSQTVGPLTWYVANDVCSALGIANPRDAVSRLDDDERCIITMQTAGGPQKMNAVSPAGVYRLIFSSRKRIAREYQRWVTHDVLPFIDQEAKHGTAVDGVGKRLDELMSMLKDSGVLKPFVNPRYTFDNLMNRFMAAVSGARPRDFYEALGQWYGVSVPYSNTINITVKEWLLEHIPLEVMQDFVVGVEGKTVVLSEAGRWVSLNGVFGNTVEWEKVKKEFGNRCAYCGKNHVALIPEHIVPQSVMGRVHPERVDLIENIVPSCSHCNSVKKLKSLKDFFEQEKDFTQTRLKKIQEHYRKYHIK